MPKRPGAEARQSSSPENGHGGATLDLSSREDDCVGRLRTAVLAFGGVDIVINTAAIYPTPDPSAAGSRTRSGRRPLHVTVTGNYVLAQEGRQPIGKAQESSRGHGGWTSSAKTAVVPKSGSEA